MQKGTPSRKLGGAANGKRIISRTAQAADFERLASVFAHAPLPEDDRDRLAHAYRNLAKATLEAARFTEYREPAQSSVTAAPPKRPTAPERYDRRSYRSRVYDRMKGWPDGGA